MITFKIHQIKDIENTNYSFRGYDPKKFNFSDYEERYEMEFVSGMEQTDLEICETKISLLVGWNRLILKSVKPSSPSLISEDRKTLRDILCQ